MSEQFNLRALVRQVIDETDLTSPDEILNKVVEMVPKQHLREALRQALRDHVKNEITRTNVAPMTPAGPSPKVAAIRDSWRKALRDRISVGPNDWMMLGDCSYEHLMYAAEERYEHARLNQAKGDWFTSLAEAVQDNGVDRVSDLPETTLRELLGGGQ